MPNNILNRIFSNRKILILSKKNRLEGIIKDNLFSEKLTINNNNEFQVCGKKYS